MSDVTMFAAVDGRKGGTWEGWAELMLELFGDVEVLWYVALIAVAGVILFALWRMLAGSQSGRQRMGVAAERYRIV